MANEVLGFYEGLASEYHLMFADWKEEILRQGVILDEFIRRHFGSEARTVLDCACGIGTQAIGLATRGYTVHATDLSPQAVERAAREAGAMGSSITWGVADFRALELTIHDTFDVVICLDNAVSHLLADDDLKLLSAEPGVLTSLKLGLPGVYSQAGSDLPRGTVPRVFDDADGRRIAFQVWDWNVGGKSYTINQFFVRQVEGEWRTSHHSTQFRALLRDELGSILKTAGFNEIKWHMPEESKFYQPIVSARA
jgi:SAM-dependent methyltransferase